MRAALLLLALWAPLAAARSLTIAEVCEGREPPRFVQRADDLLVFCPGEAVPWLTYRGCPQASVRRPSLGRYVINCGKW